MTLVGEININIVIHDKYGRNGCVYNERETNGSRRKEKTDESTERRGRKER